MSAKHFWLKHDLARGRAAAYILEQAPEDWHVLVEEPKRTTEQNAKFHAMVGDIAKSGLQWAGKARTAAQWKVLLVSGHAVATQESVEIVPGLENEFVNLRESTALMSVKRGASLIEYTLAFCAQNNVRLSAPSRGEFN